MGPEINPSKSLKIMAKYPKYWKAHITQEAKNHHNLVQTLGNQ